MIELAQKNLEDANLTESVKLQNVMIQDVGPIPDVKTVISLGVLHHFENPNEFWESIIRITDGTPSVAMVLDLVRPEEEWVIDELEALFKDTHPELYVQDTLNSLRAAFTEEEVRNQLSQLELNHDIKVHINPATGAELMLIQVKLNQ
jgi:2-polyprenyl-3-methyl-5-hydroxy-6-metoxy-1,4-benzoquinol methylase